MIVNGNTEYKPPNRILNKEIVKVEQGISEPGNRPSPVQKCKKYIEKRYQYWVSFFKGFERMENSSDFSLIRDGKWFVSVECRIGATRVETFSVSYVASDERITGPWKHHHAVRFESDTNEWPGLSGDEGRFIEAVVNPELLPTCLGMDAAIDDIIYAYMKDEGVVDVDKVLAEL